MPLFEYTAIRRDGSELTATEVADTESALHEKLKKRRLLVVSSKELKLKKIPEKISSQLMFELDNLLDSGIVLEKALQIIAEDNPEKELADLSLALRESIKGGRTMAESLSQLGQFDRLLIPMINAGESSGKLNDILEKMSLYYEKKNALKGDIMAALAYPLVLIFVSIFSILGLVIYVIPTFKEIFSDNMGALPLGTRIIFASTDWLHAYGVIALSVFIAIVLLIIIAFKFSPALRIKWDQFSLSIPVAGKLLAKNSAIILLGTLSILLKSGVPLVKALDLLQYVIANRAQRAAIAEGIKLIKQGKQMPEVLKLIPHVPSIGHRLVKVGNESGKLGESMAKAAALLEQELTKELKALVSMLEPVIILFMGGTVGFIVVSMLLAVFSLTDFA